MEANRKYAWMFFGLALLCSISASVYAMRGNSAAAPPPEEDDGPGMDGPGMNEPGFVPVMPASPTLAPAQPASAAASSSAAQPPPAAASPPGALVYTAPGGWVWNPLYYNNVYWDVRRDPYWRYDWGFARERDGWRRSDWRRHRWA